MAVDSRAPAKLWSLGGLLLATLSEVLTGLVLFTIKHNIQEEATMTDFNELKAKQQKAWSTGDYAKVGQKLVLVSERLCETD